MSYSSEHEDEGWGENVDAGGLPAMSVSPQVYDNESLSTDENGLKWLCDGTKGCLLVTGLTSFSGPVFLEGDIE